MTNETGSRMSGGSRLRWFRTLAGAVLVLAATAGSQTSDAAGICPCILLPLAATPSTTGLSTANGRPGGPWTLEVGVKFTVDAAARLSAFSFYKDAGETGAHVGRLWTADGVLLANVPFGAETASGWQQQALVTPIELAPGTTYVASVGFNASFVQTIGGLAASVGSGPLHSVADGQNGVFADAAGSFPTQSFSSSNYFVNVEVLDDGVPAAPTLASTSPVNGATRVALGAAASAVVTRDLDATTVTSGATLERSDGAPVAAAVAYDSASRRITITPAAQLDPLTTYVARLSTTVDAADGTPLAGPVSWRFTTGNVAPTIVARTPAVGATGVSIDSNARVSALIADKVAEALRA